MGNFGEILLIGGKSTWEKKYICTFYGFIWSSYFLFGAREKITHTRVEDVRL